jgi:NAD(P)H-dependent flavin oxidoreductase YrpB (nitropropane dioxygenase family)
VRCLGTALCDRLGIDLPIVQAPVGSAAGPELVAAVSEAGGLGMLALTWHTPSRRAVASGGPRSLSSAHHRVDTLSDTVPLITGWLDRTHP